MSQLALFLFGSPSIERDGVVLNVDTRKATALLAYLAVTRQRQSRDTLATLLWSDYDQPHARATLRRTLSVLNKALGGEWLEIEREVVGLNPVNFSCDVDYFQRCLAQCRTHQHPSTDVCPDCLDPLTKAVETYRNDFMAGFHLHESANFDDWLFFQADTLRQALAHTLEMLVRIHSANAAFEHAILYARRWLILDRLHEPAHQQLMRLYAWSGQRNAALHHYQECTQILEQELGVAPLEETTQLYGAIKANQVLPPPRQIQSPVILPSKSSSPMPVEAASNASTAPAVAALSYPLVGRVAEWNTLLQTYTKIQREGCSVILEGEAGIGKTRLAEEFLRYARSHGVLAVEARCYEGETNLAYAPIVAALRDAITQRDQWKEMIAEHWLSEAARLLPEITTPTLSIAPSLDNPGAQSRFFEGLRQILLTLCEGDSRGKGVGVLFFDDLQWADTASLDVLHYLVHRLHDHRVCLILTWRTTQGNTISRLQTLLTTVQRSPNANILVLSRLDQPTTEDLVRAVVPSEMPSMSNLASRLYKETEGVPFFLMEYLAAIAKGILIAEDTNWSLPGGYATCSVHV